jgi:hypothetical protein
MSLVDLEGFALYLGKMRVGFQIRASLLNDTLVHWHADRRAGRQADWQADRWTDGQTESNIDRQTVVWSGMW